MSTTAPPPEPLSTAPLDTEIDLDRHLLGLAAGGETRSRSRPAEVDGDGRSRAAQYRQLLDGLGVAMYTTDAAGRITFFNAAAAEFWEGALRSGRSGADRSASFGLTRH